MVNLKKLVYSIINKDSKEINDLVEFYKETYGIEVNEFLEICNFMEEAEKQGNNYNYNKYLSKYHSKIKGKKR